MSEGCKHRGNASVNWSLILFYFLFILKSYMDLKINVAWCQYLNTLRPRRNEQHFADGIFKRIFFNKNVWISIQISLKFVPKGPINNIPVLVLIMAWCRSGDKPLSEPMMVSLPTHICVTRPQWVKPVLFSQYFDSLSRLVSIDSFDPCETKVLISAFLLSAGQC